MTRNEGEPGNSGPAAIRAEALKYSREEGLRSGDDSVTVEEPLEIRICREGRVDCRTVSVTMRTPGMDFDLSVGFLFTEGIIRERKDVLSVSYESGEKGWAGNIVEVEVPDGVFSTSTGYNRNFAMNSSCGVCGKSSINEVFTKGRGIIRSGISVPASVILELPSAMRKKQRIFSRTGGIHAAGLFTPNLDLQALAEDVGRHNAVDKVLGRFLMEGRMPASESILQLSGRAGFELVQKAVVAGIPVISAVSAPTSLAIEIARTFNATLACFVRNGRFTVYTAPERIDPAK